MAVFRSVVLLAAVGVLSVEAHRANPVRRVVDMLQGMSDKVKKEGEAEQALFDKFMCYCTSTANELKMAIQYAETKIPQVTSSLETTKAEHAQLGQDLVKGKADRAEAEGAIKEATALRKKEAATFAKDSSDFKTNVAALGKAIGAIEQGTGGSFLQTSAADRLQQITLDVEMSSVDRDAVSAFLTQGQQGQSGEIIGILKQLKETMEGDLAEITATEQKAINDFNGLVAAREKEINDVSAALEAKLAREGEVGESIVMIAEDLDDSSKALPRDQKFLADLGKTCSAKEAEWEERKKLRTEELLAIADTIKIMNSDEALELFKKTLPSASLLQMLVSTKEMKQQALGALRGHRDSRLEFIALTLRGGAKNFDKVLAMIDGMVKLLGDEQKSDDKKKAYCEAALDKAEDEKKVLDQTSADLEKAIEEAKESIATVTDELAALADGITKLDADVAEATQMRQNEHAEFSDTTASNNGAKELIGMAQNRLKKFYGFVQVASHKGYAQKSEEGAGVLEMLNMMVADLDKEIQTATVDEKNAQAAYEQFVADSGDKRAQDVQTITDKEGAKSETEGSLEKLTLEHKDTQSGTMAKEEEIKDLHQECDWSLSNHAARKEARAGEVDSLKKAKAVLSGADYSFLQTAVIHRVALRR